MLRTTCLTLALIAGSSVQADAQATVPRTQVRFAGPAGMQIRWYYQRPDGKGAYSDPPLEAPARYSFRQGGIYRLKLTHIPGFAGLELYPTLQVLTPGPAGQEFLAHNAAALELTREDFAEVVSGKYITKAIRLPADSGGEVLLILRVGNLDAEAPTGKD